MNRRRQSVARIVTEKVKVEVDMRRRNRLIPRGKTGQVGVNIWIDAPVAYTVESEKAVNPRLPVQHLLEKNQRGHTLWYRRVQAACQEAVLVNFESEWNMHERNYRCHFPKWGDEQKIARM